MIHWIQLVLGQTLSGRSRRLRRHALRRHRRCFASCIRKDDGCRRSVPYSRRPLNQHHQQGRFCLEQREPLLRGAPDPWPDPCRGDGVGRRASIPLEGFAGFISIAFDRRCSARIMPLTDRRFINALNRAIIVKQCPSLRVPNSSMALARLLLPTDDDTGHACERAATNRKERFREGANLRARRIRRLSSARRLNGVSTK
jgi:hypothetical protein